MSENTRVSTPPPAAAKDKGKARLPRARLGEIYMHDRDDYDVWSEIEWGASDAVDEAVRRAVLNPPAKPTGTGDLMDAWRHLKRKWKIVIIVSWTGMLILGLLSILLPYFVPQASLHQHVSNKSLNGKAPVGTWKSGVQRRLVSEIVAHSSASAIHSAPVHPPSVTVATPTVKPSSQSAPSVLITPTPESTVAVVPVSFNA